MLLREVKGILQQLSDEAMSTSLLGNSSAEVELARLAKQMIAILDRDVKKSLLDEQTISFAPSRCPCCGR